MAWGKRPEVYNYLDEYIRNDNSLSDKEMMELPPDKAFAYNCKIISTYKEAWMWIECCLDNAGSSNNPIPIENIYYCIDNTRCTPIVKFALKIMTALQY